MEKNYKTFKIDYLGCRIQGILENMMGDKLSND